MTTRSLGDVNAGDTACCASKCSGKYDFSGISKGFKLGIGLNG